MGVVDNMLCALSLIVFYLSLTALKALGLSTSTELALVLTSKARWFRELAELDKAEEVIKQAKTVV